jgi:hypothetical protein
MTSIDDKKLGSEACVEPIESQKPVLENIDDDPVYSRKEQREIIRRVDFRLVLMLGALHCVCLIDRGNIGAAKLAGMSTELNLIGNRYVSWVQIFLDWQLTIIRA